MRVLVDEELLTIFTEIERAAKTQEQWEEIESDDMFQTENFEGGYDATEESFCFSYYDAGRKEHWFQVSLEEIKEILKESNEKEVYINAVEPT